MVLLYPQALGYQWVQNRQKYLPLGTLHSGVQNARYAVDMEIVGFLLLWQPLFSDLVPDMTPSEASFCAFSLPLGSVARGSEPTCGSSCLCLLFTVHPKSSFPS